jgi:hypothetical protein
LPHRWKKGNLKKQEAFGRMKRISGKIDIVMKKILISAILILLSVLCSAQNHIINNTKYNNVEYIVNFTLDYFNINDVIVIVNNFDIVVNTTRIETNTIKATVIKNNDNVYSIYIAPGMSNYEIMLIHETIHLKQYYTGDLIILNKNVVMYKNKKINLKTTQSDLRSFEIEARKIGKEIFNLLRQNIQSQYNSPGCISCKV